MRRLVLFLTTWVLPMGPAIALIVGICDRIQAHIPRKTTNICRSTYTLSHEGMDDNDATF